MHFICVVNSRPVCKITQKTSNYYVYELVLLVEKDTNIQNIIYKNQRINFSLFDKKNKKNKHATLKMQ